MTSLKSTEGSFTILVFFYLNFKKKEGAHLNLANYLLSEKDQREGRDLEAVMFMVAMGIVPFCPCGCST